VCFLTSIVPFSACSHAVVHYSNPGTTRRGLCFGLWPIVQQVVRTQASPWRCQQQLYTLDVGLTRPVISDDNSTRRNQLLALSMVSWVDGTANVGTQQKCVQLNRDYLRTTHRTTVRRYSRVLALGVLLLFKYHPPRVNFSPQDRPPAFHPPQLCVFRRKDDISYATMLGSNSYLQLCDYDFVSDAHCVYRSRLESAIDGRQKKDGNEQPMSTFVRR
jgi:hypothetical protein